MDTCNSEPRCKCRKVLLPEIADVERAVSGKIYPAGTVYIQVSAARRMGLEQFKITDADGTIENKYAVIIPKVKAYPLYLLTALNKYADRFMHRYVGTNINIDVHNFKYFELYWHDGEPQQRRLMEQLEPIQKEIKLEREIVAAIREFKGQMLRDMFVSSEEE